MIIMGIIMIRGEVSEERREKAEKLQLELNKLNVSTEQMADMVSVARKYYSTYY